MNTIMIKNITQTALFTLICLTLLSTLAQAAEEEGSTVYDTEFDKCFSDGYNASALTKEQIYITAECFKALIDIDATQETTLGASELTILQYAISWYDAAAVKGHKKAGNQLKSQQELLVSLVSDTHFGGVSEAEQMFASETQFKALDTDGDGLLSLNEAAESNRVIQNFSKTDYDNDGMISSGEYAIEFGEMTAAGK